MEIPILQDIVAIFGISVVVLYICEKIHLPSIVGFIVTGALIGPDGFHWIRSHHHVELLAEIGVIVLMFTIGLELSIKELVQRKKAVLLGGSLQVFLSILATLGISHYAGIPMGEGIFIGFLVALSSTAIVLGVLQDRGETHTPYGRNIIAILIFQDVIMVVMMLLTPLLASDESVSITSSLLFLLLKAAIIIGLVIISTRFVIPKLFYLITRSKNQEFFLLSIVGICLITAWASAEVGLSLGLGAFLAGLVISESEYSLRALSSIFPFRGVFLSFFFVSVGTLFNVGFFWQNLPLILGLTLGVMILKALLIFAVGAVLRWGFYTTFVAGLSLSQIGEFSFMLSKTGVDFNLLNERSYQIFLSVTALSMVFTPFLIFLAPKLAARLSPFLSKVLGPEESEENQLEVTESLKDHLIIIGYGTNGKLLAKSAKHASIPYVIVEVDAAIAKRETENDEPIICGDATQESLLQHLAIENASLVIVAISDLQKTRQIITSIKQLSPTTRVLVRTRFIMEVEHLTQLGADNVISVEFEAALEIERQMLNHFLILPNEVDQLIESVRSGGYQKYIDEKQSEVKEDSKE